MWSWGDGDCGKLGRGGSEVTKVPKVIPGLVGVKKVVCGSQFTLALTDEGKVFSWYVCIHRPSLLYYCV